MKLSVEFIAVKRTISKLSQEIYIYFFLELQLQISFELPVFSYDNSLIG